MTESTLFVRRLVIIYKGKSVYDERFHDGINVIRGDHSVGKTTILELLFYALGGEIKENQWLYPADQCDVIFCEVELNKIAFTLKRDISKGKIPPISIRQGRYGEKPLAESGWKTYGSRRSESENKMSFSQQIFELLGWDTHKTEDYANLTMHQILRFLYVDQETASTKIFRAEDNPRGDSEGIRTAIAEFLLGLDNLDTHKLRQDLIISEREFDRIFSDLAAMYRVLGEDAMLTPELLQKQINDNVKEIISLSELPLVVQSDDESATVNNLLYKRAEASSALLNKQLQNFRQELFSTEGELVDCLMFEESLNFRKKALLESKTAYDAIGIVKYSRCPCCLEAIIEDDSTSCHLCRTPNKDVARVNNYMELLNQLDFQIQNNRKVFDDYREHETGLRNSIEIAEINLRKSQAELSSLAKRTSTISPKLIENSRRIGYLESQNAGAEKKIRIIQELNSNQQKKVSLAGRISDLREQLAAAQASNLHRRQDIYFGLSENVVSILSKDHREDGNPYEEEFDNPNIGDIEIDFSKDRMLVNERVKFSGSSNYIKKNALHISALIESIERKSYRLPRFLMLDAIENGGMREFRSQLFQKSIFDVFKGQNNFQLILCTSMVLSEFDNEEYGVGPFYNNNVLQID